MAQVVVDPSQLGIGGQKVHQVFTQPDQVGGGTRSLVESAEQFLTRRLDGIEELGQGGSRAVVCVSDSRSHDRLGVGIETVSKLAEKQRPFGICQNGVLVENLRRESDTRRLAASRQQQSAEVAQRFLGVSSAISAKHVASEEGRESSKGSWSSHQRLLRECKLAARSNGRSARFRFELS